MLRIINRKIASINHVKVSISVLFPDDRSAINMYSPDTTHLSLYIDYPVFLTIELPKDKNAPDQRHRKFNLSAYTQDLLVEAMYDFLEIYNNDDIYYLDGGKLQMYAPIKDEYKRRVLLGENWLMFIPIIVLDQDANQYEGVEITLNKEGNNVLLTYGEFKALAKIISKVDIFVYSQLLLNFIGKNTVFRSEDERRKLDEKHNQIDARLNAMDFSAKPKESDIYNNRVYAEKERMLKKERLELSKQWTKEARERKKNDERNESNEQNGN